MFPQTSGSPARSLVQPDDDDGVDNSGEDGDDNDGISNDFYTHLSQLRHMAMSGEILWKCDQTLLVIIMMGDDDDNDVNQDSNDYGCDYDKDNYGNDNDNDGD